MSPTGSLPGKLLIVEDDEGLRTMLSSALQMRGYEVTEADSRKSALAAVQTDSEIKVMIVDLGLPPATHCTDEGIALIQNIQQLDSASKIIVLTGQDEESAALAAIREGAFDFLAKPAMLENLLRSLERAFLFVRQEHTMANDGMTRLQINARIADGLKAVREDAEEKLVRQVLRDTDFNVYKSAARLGIKRESIYYFLKKFGIQRDPD